METPSNGSEVPVFRMIARLAHEGSRTGGCRNSAEQGRAPEAAIRSDFDGSVIGAAPVTPVVMSPIPVAVR